MNNSPSMTNRNGNVDIGGELPSYYKQKMQDPEYAARRRAYGREQMRKWRSNSENRKRQLENDRQPKRRAKQYAAHQRRMQNPEYRARYNRTKLKSFFVRAYGLTVEQRNQLFSENGGMCMICNVNPSEHVDHCHDTGRVQGALCNKCNLGLGHFGDSVEQLQAAIQYIKGTKQLQI